MQLKIKFIIYRSAEQVFNKLISYTPPSILSSQPRQYVQESEDNYV